MRRFISRSGLLAKDVLLSLLASQDHPSITSLDLSNNPIGDRGGMVLADLLRSNTSIVEVDIKGTHVAKRYFRDHHSHLGPSDCEGGRPILQQLQENNTLRAKSPSELVRMLMWSRHELRAMFAAWSDKKTSKASGGDCRF